MTYADLERFKGAYSCSICGRTFNSEREADECEEKCEKNIPQSKYNFRLWNKILKTKYSKKEIEFFNKFSLRTQICLTGDISDIIEAQKFIIRFQEKHKQLISFIIAPLDLDLYGAILGGYELGSKYKELEANNFLIELICPELRDPEEIVRDMQPAEEEKIEVLNHYYLEEDSRIRARIIGSISSLYAQGKIKEYKWIVNIKHSAINIDYLLGQLADYKESFDKEKPNKLKINFDYFTHFIDERDITKQNISILKEKISNPKIDYNKVIEEGARGLFEHFKGELPFFWVSAFKEFELKD